MNGCCLSSGRSSSESRGLELLQKCARRQDRQLVAERKHVCVTRNKWCALARSQREQVVVAGVIRVNGRWSFGVRHDLPNLLEQPDEPKRVLGRNSAADLWLVQRSLHLVEQGLADDKLEVTLEPQLNQSRQRPHSRDQSRDEDVGVEDRAHALRAAALVLRLHREAESLILVEVGGLPDALEQIEPEVAPKRFLDHIAVTAAAASRLHPHRAQDPLVHRDCRSGLRHIRIIASI